MFHFTDQSSASWEGSFPLTDEKEEEELDEEEDDEDEEEKKKRSSSREEASQPLISSSTLTSTSVTSSTPPPVCASSSSPAPPPDLPVCAKNISLTASGEKVILWTRYASSLLPRPPLEGAAGVRFTKRA